MIFIEIPPLPGIPSSLSLSLIFTVSFRLLVRTITSVSNHILDFYWFTAIAFVISFTLIIANFSESLIRTNNCIKHQYIRPKKMELFLFLIYLSKITYLPSI